MNAETPFTVVCARCGAPAADREQTTCLACGGATRVMARRDGRRAIDAAAPGLWRYRDWLPVAAAARIVTLGEGGTPLVRLERWGERAGLREVYAKLEYAGPTGSFKDRGATVLVTHAVAAGAERLVEDSSGNAGAAIAAYAARAGLACTIFAPATAPAGKLRQVQAHGATLIAVEGSRDDVAAAALRAGAAPGAYYAGHNANPYFVEGTKTLAFELAETFAGNAPEHLIMPVGGGSLLLGCFYGFQEWLQDGRISATPRLHAVQSSGCMPLVAAYSAGAPQPLPVTRRPTIAGGITIEHPHRGALLLHALRETRGAAVAVDDAEILRAQRDLARLEGIFCEPTSAAAFAGLLRLVAQGVIAPGDRAVVAVTGGGLKDPQSVELWPA